MAKLGQTVQFFSAQLLLTLPLAFGQVPNPGGGGGGTPPPPAPVLPYVQADARAYAHEAAKPEPAVSDSKKTKLPANTMLPTKQISVVAGRKIKSFSKYYPVDGGHTRTAQGKSKASGDMVVRTMAIGPDEILDWQVKSINCTLEDFADQGPDDGTGNPFNGAQKIVAGGGASKFTAQANLLEDRLVLFHNVSFGGISNKTIMKSRFDIKRNGTIIRAGELRIDSSDPNNPKPQLFITKPTPSGPYSPVNGKIKLPPMLVLGNGATFKFQCWQSNDIVGNAPVPATNLTTSHGLSIITAD